MKFLSLIVFSSLSNFSLASETWMRYPKISPDGTQIAFSYQGEIFVVSSKGGKAQQLTTHEAYDFMPIWSPDSKNIVFASNRHGNNDLFMVSAEGGSCARLTFHSSNDLPYAFHPDGKSVIYGSNHMDDQASIQFPSGALREVYSVNISGGREKMLLSVPAENCVFNSDGNQMLFYNAKGYEDEWRKHHQSSVTRDIVLYDFSTKIYKQITNWNGEDRDPVFGKDGSFYFLSEKSGSFNLWQGNLYGGEPYAKQLTQFEKHPLRFLSIANDGKLCFGFHGEIYLYENGKSNPISIEIRKDENRNNENLLSVNSNPSEFVISPDGKEMAFIVRGNVFVSSVEHGTTKQITSTPGQERNISFSPDGKKILYASEREKSWDVYETERLNDKETHFFNSTLLKETAIVQSLEEEFDPKYSPDGKEIAFLQNRTALMVYNVGTKLVRKIMPASSNYSYSDGDQYFAWSPDSKYLLVQFFDNDRWNSDIGLVSASGKEKPLNLTESGYGSFIPKFAMNGEMVYYGTDKYGMRSHGSWGSQGDVEAIFLTKDAFYKYTLNEEDYTLWKEAEDAAKKDKEESDEKTKKKDKKEDKEKTEEVAPLKIDLSGLGDRKVRLTTHSSDLGDFLLNEDGTELYYLSNFEKGYDLWNTSLKKGETKLISKIGTYGSGIEFDKEKKFLFFAQNGTVMKYDLAASTSKPVGFNTEMKLDAAGERAYMFEHAWRQVREKFYVEDLHGVDWDFYKKEYQPKLASINNSIDFSEMLSEMLGELNASHTGAGTNTYNPKGDQTAVFGCFFDESFAGDGLKITEIIDKSPLTLHSTKIQSGTVIEKIDGESILKDKNYFSLLNRKVGKKVLLSLSNPVTKEKWDEIVVPISMREQNRLLYERYIKRCEHIVDSLSNGKLAYVHIEGMDSESFRQLYDKALGKYNQKEGIIIDTRFNGGGWLHDDLATFLSGKAYMSFEPRGQKNMGGEPLSKWQKPSCVLMSEGNYSDAHLFPYTYKALGIGKLIGMPVAGTGTAVWWETMVDGATWFGIPQVGMRSLTEGFLVENHELQPDILVENEYAKFLKGIDQQLEAAVKELMGQ